MDPRRERQREYKEALDAQVREKQQPRRPKGQPRARPPERDVSPGRRDPSGSEFLPQLPAGVDGRRRNERRDVSPIRGPNYGEDRSPDGQAQARVYPSDFAGRVGIGGGRNASDHPGVSAGEFESLVDTVQRLGQEIERTRSEGARHAASALRLHQVGCVWGWVGGAGRL